LRMSRSSRSTLFSRRNRRSLVIWRFMDFTMAVCLHSRRPLRRCF
jgi:hypothetical protein